jgi:hypothetical protein
MAVLGPALFADERYEHHSAEICLLVLALARARGLEQLLMALLRANRNDEASADSELRFQGMRHRGSSRGYQNGIERRRFGPATRAIARA